MSTRYAIPMDRDGAAWWVCALQQYTNPAWTGREGDAKTWVGAAAARAKGRAFAVPDEGQVVAVDRIAPPATGPGPGVRSAAPPASGCPTPACRRPRTTARAG